MSLELPAADVRARSRAHLYRAGRACAGRHPLRAAIGVGAGAFLGAHERVDGCVCSA